MPKSVDTPKAADQPKDQTNIDFGFKKPKECKGNIWWCVAVKKEDDGSAAVKDTKTNEVLNFSKQEWDVFVRAVKNGEFD